MPDTIALTRTITTERPGPVYLHLTAPHAVVTVTADPTLTTATLTLTPNNPHDAAARAAVTEAVATPAPTDYLGVVVPGAAEATPPLVVITAHVPAGSEVETHLTYGTLALHGPLSDASYQAAAEADR